jgi:hypothetical protein
VVFHFDAFTKNAAASFFKRSFYTRAGSRQSLAISSLRAFPMSLKGLFASDNLFTPFHISVLWVAVYLIRDR